MAAVKFKKGDKKIKMRIENAWKKELAPLSEVILKDCNSFCPQDQKSLIASSYQASNLKNGILKWDAPNAKKAYYTGISSDSDGTGTGLMWCAKAKKKFGKSWEKAAKELFQKEMGK